MFKSRADLLIAAGESIKMQEKHGIDPVCKLDNEKTFLKHKEFFASPSRYEFPLAVVEGKPVFVGDELYAFNGTKGKVLKLAQDLDCNDMLVFEPYAKSYIDSCSWNPPKPATVMVELLREDAEWLSRQAQERLAETYSLDRAGLACRKALEETK